MAAFKSELSQLKELYNQFGADLFALCYLQAGRPAYALDLMAACLCDMAASPKLWTLATSGREGFLRVGYLNCLDASLRRPKRVKRKKGESPEETPRAVLPFSMTDPLRNLLKLRIAPRTALFCRERLELSPAEGARLLGVSPARFQRLADAGLKKAGITQGQARANLEAITPGEENLEKVWDDFLFQQGQGGFATRQQFRRIRRALDTAMPYLALGVVVLGIVAYAGVEYGWFGNPPYSQVQVPTGQENSSADLPEWVGDVSVFVPEGEGFVEYVVHNTPGTMEDILRQMVYLGGAPEGVTLLSASLDGAGTESQDGSAAAYSQGDTLTLTVELSDQAASLSGEEGVAMLQAMAATFGKYSQADTLSLRCQGQELTVEGHTAQEFLGQELTITRTVETDYRE